MSTESTGERKSADQKTTFLWRRYLGAHWLSLFFALLGGGVAAVTGGFGIPTVLKSMIPVIFEGKPLPDWAQDILLYFVKPADLVGSAVWAAAASFSVIVVVRGLSSFVNVYFLTKVGLSVLEKLRIMIYGRFQDLSLSFHDRCSKGDLLSRLMQDTQFIQNAMIQVTNDLVIQPLTLMAALGYLVYQSSVNSQFLILLVNMLLVGACVVPIRFIGKMALKKARRVQASQGDISDVLQENFSSQRDIRAFELEEHQTQLFKDRIAGFIKASIGVARWKSLNTPLIEFLSAIAMAVTLYIANENGMGMEDFAALATAMYLCYEPVKRLGVVQTWIKMLHAAMERINEVLDAPDEVPDPALPEKIEHWRGEVEFCGVGFGYQADAPVMKDVNVHIPAGQVVALVGPSGSGKTTLINLLCRFYDVNEGCVKVDGVDVRHMLRRDLLSHIALVSQFPVLFRGTVADNIRIGHPGATAAEVQEAGRMAAVDSFIHETPEGYDRMLAERGEGLSGGQRQRVSLARAFLKNAPILVLDEATASLDMKSEELIQKEIEKLAAGRTTFIIAHRFSTIRTADRILVLEGGRIVADGTHAQLMESCQLYCDLYNKQQMNAQEEGGEA